MHWVHGSAWPSQPYMPFAFAVFYRAFSPKEAAEHRLPAEQRRNNTGGYDYLLNGQRYSDGYLLRSFALKSITAVEGLPDMDELQRFNAVSLGHGDCRAMMPCEHDRPACSKNSSRSVLTPAMLSSAAFFVILSLPKLARTCISLLGCFHTLSLMAHTDG